MSVRQPRLWSLLEAVTNNVVAFCISVLVQAAVFPLFGIHVDLGTNVALVLIFTALSIVRSYLLRRLFDWINWKGTS